MGLFSFLENQPRKVNLKHIYFSYINELPAFDHNRDSDYIEAAKRMFVVGYKPEDFLMKVIHKAHCFNSDYYYQPVGEDLYTEQKYWENGTTNYLNTDKTLGDFSVMDLAGNKETIFLPRPPRSGGLMVLHCEKGISDMGFKSQVRRDIILAGYYINSSDNFSNEQYQNLQYGFKVFYQKFIVRKTYDDLDFEEKRIIDNKKRKEEEEQREIIRQKQIKEREQLDKKNAEMRRTEEARKAVITKEQERVRLEKQEKELEEERRRQKENADYQWRLNLESEARQREQLEKIKAEEEAKLRVIREEAEYIERVTRMQTEAVAEEARLTAEIFAMRERLERQEKANIKGTIDEVLEAFKRKNTRS